MSFCEGVRDTHLPPQLLKVVGNTVWREIFARKNFSADWPLAKISLKNFHGSTITKPCPYWVYANHTHTTCESPVMASEFSVEAMVCGYHIYEDSGIQPLVRSCHIKVSLITVIDIGWQLDIAAPFPFANRLFQHALLPHVSQSNGGRRCFCRQGASSIW